MKYLIYFLFHSAGKVDDYVPYFLNTVRDYFDVIHVVSNGPLRDDQKHKLSMADKVQERANDEFDVGAYKAAIFSNPDDFYKSCDEVTLANFTFFAPIGSMQPYFDWVKAEDRDFWGLSAHKEMIPNPFTGKGILPYHIQSHWISVGKNILQSGDFIDYWRNLERIDSYHDSVLKHESQFTRYFAEKGYSYGLFFDDVPYDSAYPAFNCIDEAVQNGLPILKRRLFYHLPTLYFDNYDVNLRRAMEFIDDNGLFDADLIWDSVASVDPGTLYQTTDLLRIVPDASFGDGPAITTPCEVIFALTAEPDMAQLARILRLVQADCTLCVILPEGADLAEARAVAAKNPLIRSLTLREYMAGEGGYVLLAEEAKRIAALGNAPMLFALIDPNDLKRFEYGMRHLCGDAAVAAHAQAELNRSRHFGVALPVMRTYGAPSEADMLTDAYRAELRIDLAGMSFKSKIQGSFHFSEAGVLWLRADVFLKLTAEILANAIDHLMAFSDMESPDDAGRPAVIDSQKVASLMSAGVPFLATHHDYVTLVLSNTREMPRNFVKAEGRLRLVSERIGAKNPFMLDNQIEYLSQYVAQEDREALFSRIHQNAFNEGWTKASKAVWQQAFAAGQQNVQAKLDDKPAKLSTAKFNEIFKSGYKDGWAESEAKAKARGQSLFDEGFKQGWAKAAADAYGKGQADGLEQGRAEAQSLTIPKETFDEIFTQGFQKGWAEAGSGGSEAAFNAGFKDGWEKATALPASDAPSDKG